MPPALPAGDPEELGPSSLSASLVFAQWAGATLLVSLEASNKALITASSVADLAARSLDERTAGFQGTAALDTARQSSRACDELRTRIERSLRLHLPELASAAASRQAMLDELARIDPAPAGVSSTAGGSSTAAPAGVSSTAGGSSTAAPAFGSPVGVLREAVARLGALELSEEDAANGVLQAREQLAAERESLARLPELKRLAGRLGAPGWAVHLLKPDSQTFPLGSGFVFEACPTDCRRLWSSLAAIEALRRTEQRDPAAARATGGAARRLLDEREQTVCELVSASAKQALREKMSAEMCASLQRLVSAVSNAGVGADTVRAARYRADLASALEGCAHTVPCWIMPTWRISQSLPAAIGSFDLVVLDEASQSDITALPALLRGNQLLIVGDGKQVSPSSAFISEDKVRQMQTRLTKRHPYPDQLLPGKSIFDLAQTCFGDARITLTEHFRCAPPLIAFSNEKFYHGGLLPRRLPPRSQRLEPAIDSVFVPNAKKQGKVNVLEAERLVEWLHNALATDSMLREATVGIISLGGTEQARRLRALVLARFTDSQIARHSLVVGDPSSFQGDERDLILLSLTAVPGERSTTATVGTDAQRKYNVALSRARDRMVLFRSIGIEHVTNAEDLRLWTLQFFARAGAPIHLAGRSTGAGGGSRGATSSAAQRDGSSGLESQLCAFLASLGFRFSTECALGGAVVIVEDAEEDGRLCVCLDGGMGATYLDFRDERRAQTALERTGWKFHRAWRASWLVDRARCETELLVALKAANIHPESSAVASAPVLGDMQQASFSCGGEGSGAGSLRSEGTKGSSPAHKRKADGGKAPTATAAERAQAEPTSGASAGASEPLAPSKKAPKTSAGVPKAAPKGSAPTSEGSSSSAPLPAGTDLTNEAGPPAKRVKSAEPKPKAAAAARLDAPAASKLAETAPLKKRKKREDDDWEPGDD